MGQKNSGLQPGGYIALGALAIVIGIAVGSSGSGFAGFALCAVGAGLALIGVIALGIRAGKG